MEENNVQNQFISNNNFQNNNNNNHHNLNIQTNNIQYQDHNDYVISSVLGSDLKKLQEMEIFINCFDENRKYYFDIELIYCDWDEASADASFMIIINDVSEKVRSNRYK